MIRQALIDWLKLKPDLDAVVFKRTVEPDLISRMVDVIENDSGTIKFHCDKILQELSQIHPEWVYPEFDRIASHITSTNHFIQWGALITLSHLIAVDVGKKFMRIYPEFLKLATSDSMVTAANASKGLIALIPIHPELESDIVRHLIQCESRTYLNKGEVSEECRFIMIGHVLDFFDHISNTSSYKKDMVAFAKRHTENPRKKTAQKAKAFVDRHKMG
jgi:hypothetical protein